MAGMPFTFYKREAVHFDAGTYKISFDFMEGDEFEFGGVVVRLVKEKEDEKENVFELPEFYLIKEEEWSRCNRLDDELFNSLGPHTALLHLLLPSNLKGLHMKEYLCKVDEKLHWYDHVDDDYYFGDTEESAFDARHAPRVPKKYCISDHEIAYEYGDDETMQQIKDKIKSIRLSEKAKRLVVEEVAERPIAPPAEQDDEESELWSDEEETSEELKSSSSSDSLTDEQEKERKYIRHVETVAQKTMLDLCEALGDLAYKKA